MKKIIPAVLGATLMMSQAWADTTAANDYRVNDREALAAVLDVSTFDQAEVMYLNDAEMQETQGAFGLLGLIGTIGALDLALIGTYWGVYVPYFAPTDPTFTQPIMSHR